MAVVVGVLVAVFGLELALFGDDIGRNVELVLTDRSAAARAMAPRRPAPLPAPAPPAAGVVTQVDLRPIDTCRAETACHVLLQVGITAQPQPVPVAWHLEVVDRCGSLGQRQPGGPVEVPAGQDRMVQTLPLDLPAGRALAVIPVVTQPARAAGRPMELPGAGDTC